MEPALRIAQSLQLSKFGWNYAIPDAQLALMASLKRLRTGRSETESSTELPDRSHVEPFPVKLSGVENTELRDQSSDA